MKHRALVVILAALPLSARAAPEVTWAQVEPLLRARFALQAVDKYFSYTTEAPLPPSDTPDAVRHAVEEVTTPTTDVGGAALRRCSLGIAAAMQVAAPVAAAQGLDAGTARLRLAVFENARTARILRNSVAQSLQAGGARCGDCAVAGPPTRVVHYADFAPYLSRFIAVGRGDLSRPGGHFEFHICSGINGLRGLDHVDQDLGATAVAAMFRATSEAKPAVEHAGYRLGEVARAHPGDETPERLAAVNDAIWSALATDREFLDGLRPLIASECAAAGLSCDDCAPAVGRPVR